jgi:WD40 repeat protein
VAHNIVNSNIKLDLFSDFRYEFKEEQELIVKSPEKLVNYPEKSKVLCMCFRSKGTHLAVGGSDGLIEIYDPNNYQVNINYSYQS